MTHNHNIHRARAFVILRIGCKKYHHFNCIFAMAIIILLYFSSLTFRHFLLFCVCVLFVSSIPIAYAASASYTNHQLTQIGSNIIIN